MPLGRCNSYVKRSGSKSDTNICFTIAIVFSPNTSGIRRFCFWTESDFTGSETDEEKFRRSFERLVLALRADDFARIPPPQQKL
jgi:hypothetical protein